MINVCEMVKDNLDELKYEEALAEYEKCRCTGLGRLIANREVPVLKRAKELLTGTNISG